jgi:hypothetical protein
MGEILVNISPFAAFVQRFVPRLLDGLIVGFIFRGVSALKNVRSYYILTGIVSALFGFALFMSGMLLLNYDKEGKYKMNDQMREFIGTPSMFIYACVFVALISFFIGYLIVSSKKLTQAQVACAITGFCTALLNTVFFMTALVVLFGDTEYMKGLIDGRNVLLFVVTFVGVNALFEMITTTVITTAVGAALFKAKLIPSPSSSAAPAEAK